MEQSTLNKLFDDWLKYKMPLDIEGQHELRGALTSAIIVIYRHEQRIEEYKRSFRKLSDLIQELIMENEQKTQKIKEMEEIA